MIHHLNEQFVPDTNLPQTSLHLLLPPSSICFDKAAGIRVLVDAAPIFDAFPCDGQFRTGISAVPDFCLVNISPWHLLPLIALLCYSPYLIFFLFSPQVQFLAQLFSTQKRVNCDKTDFTTKESKSPQH